jgi:hypothetical protein
MKAKPSAIRAGLDIIEALTSLEVPEVDCLQVRIGIAAGMVVVSSAEKGAVGETMNLATRLQGIAQVNTIVVSERVQHLAGGRFVYRNLGKQALKGIAQPSHAYAIAGVSEAASRFEAARGGKRRHPFATTHRATPFWCAISRLLCGTRPSFPFVGQGNQECKHETAGSGFSAPTS